MIIVVLCCGVLVWSLVWPGCLSFSIFGVGAEAQR
jgi:hypothetical protein